MKKIIILCLTCILFLTSCILAPECKVTVINPSSSYLYVKNSGTLCGISAHSSMEIKVSYTIGRATVHIFGEYYDSKDVSIDVGLFGTNTTYEPEPDYGYVSILNKHDEVVKDVKLNGYEAVYIETTGGYIQLTGNSIIQRNGYKYVKVPKNTCNTKGSITYTCGSKTYKIDNVQIPKAGNCSYILELSKSDTEVK